MFGVIRIRFALNKKFSRLHTRNFELSFGLVDIHFRAGSNLLTPVFLFLSKVLFLCVSQGIAAIFSLDFQK